MTNTKHPLNQLDGHINTYSGKKLNLLDPFPEDINIQDISRGLAYNSHFGGQTPRFFSIAEHCLLVFNLMERAGRGFSPEILMAALLHDASEAYLGDMVKPLKVLLPEFQKIEQRMMEVIFDKYQLPMEHLATIKPFDQLAQKIEYRAFYKNGATLHHFSPDQSRYRFKERYYNLVNLRVAEKSQEPWTSIS